MAYFRKIIAIAIIFCLASEQSGFAQVSGQIGIPAYLGALVPVVDRFHPVHLRSISINAQTNDFLVSLEKGDVKNLSPAEKEKTALKLMEYFRIGLRLPNSMFWVNLRPDAPDTIIDPLLEKTDLGKVLLEADLQLKKDLSLLTDPGTKMGKAYWDKLYAKAGSLYPGQDVEIPTTTRPWIVPGEIIIGQNEHGAYVYKASLKVMLEADWVKATTSQEESSLRGAQSATKQSESGQLEPETYNQNLTDPNINELNDYSTQLIKESILPQLTREINASKKYAPLRQVYYSLVLAQYFKARLKSVESAVIAKSESDVIARSESDVIARSESAVIAKSESAVIARSESAVIARSPKGATKQSLLYSALKIDSKDLTGLISQQSWTKNTYFQTYRKSFSEGEYNKKEQMRTDGEITIRQYCSGGENFSSLDSSIKYVPLSSGNLAQNGGATDKELIIKLSEISEGMSFVDDVPVKLSKDGGISEEDKRNIERVLSNLYALDKGIVVGSFMELMETYNLDIKNPEIVAGLVPSPKYIENKEEIILLWGKFFRENKVTEKEFIDGLVALYSYFTRIGTNNIKTGSNIIDVFPEFITETLKRDFFRHGDLPLREWTGDNDDTNLRTRLKHQCERLLDKGVSEETVKAKFKNALYEFIERPELGDWMNYEVLEVIIGLARIASDDPDLIAKKRSREIVKNVSKEINNYINNGESETALERALKACVAANSLDFADREIARKFAEDPEGFFSEQIQTLGSGDFWARKEDANQAIEKQLKPLIKAGKTFLLLLDNAGEDYINLISIVPQLLANGGKVLIGGKSMPAGNDAMSSEIRELLEKDEYIREVLGESINRVSVVDTGMINLGFNVMHASKELDEAWKQSDMVILFGQSNFYTSRPWLQYFNKKIITLLRIKWTPEGYGYTRGDNVLEYHKSKSEEKDGGVADDLGGIDLRAMPMISQPMADGWKLFSGINARQLQALAEQADIKDLDAAWQNVLARVNTEVPYERIRQYLAVCLVKQDAAHRRIVLAWLKNTLALEEEYVIETPAEMLELVAMAG